MTYKREVVFESCCEHDYVDVVDMTTVGENSPGLCQALYGVH